MFDRFVLKFEKKADDDDVGDDGADVDGHDGVGGDDDDDDGDDDSDDVDVGDGDGDDDGEEAEPPWPFALACPVYVVPVVVFSVWRNVSGGGRMSG